MLLTSFPVMLIAEELHLSKFGDYGSISAAKRGFLASASICKQPSDKLQLDQQAIGYPVDTEISSWFITGGAEGISIWEKTTNKPSGGVVVAT